MHDRHTEAYACSRVSSLDGKKPLISASVTRPLMDKTPFPNRVASGNFGNAGKTPGLKLSKIALLVPEAEQESLSPDVAPLLRPSSTRRSLRGRLSQNFKTPLTKGNHWDVSPEDMEGIDGALADDAKPETETAVADEEDEVEYMPPTAIGTWLLSSICLTSHPDALGRMSLRAPIRDARL